MRVVVVCLRAAGKKLTKAELLYAARHSGELFIEGRVTYLCGGGRPSEWPAHGHVLPPLHASRVTK
ncbi:MAG: hypothetical protein M3Z29_12810, partial [Pseudomonadota bacterium]|nr:hypothetical protein [Pseudomonadota bacterium]